MRLSGARLFLSESTNDHPDNLAYTMEIDIAITAHFENNLGTEPSPFTNRLVPIQDISQAPTVAHTIARDVISNFTPRRIPDPLDYLFVAHGSCYDPVVIPSEGMDLYICADELALRPTTELK